MHYPWWYVPGLTAPMLIAIIATVHVFVSHYAVGGGIVLAWENQFAVKTGNKEYRNYLRRHAKFFVLLTVAFGAITGVGIWWTIALASPLATEKLIRTFVFGWAIEWVFFIVEITAAFIMYYRWDKLPEKTHVIITWIYAVAAWISLVLITGITAFMLDSRGLFAHWTDTGNFWHAFFNQQFLPQTVARTGAAILLAALYILMHAAWIYRKEVNEQVFTPIIQRMRKPLFFGILLAVIGVAWSFSLLSDRAYLTMERSVLFNMLFPIFLGVSALVILLLLINVWTEPRLDFGFTVALFFLCLTALATAEFGREAIRKPWIVDQVVLGNQIYANEVAERQKSGFLRPLNGMYDKVNHSDGGMLFMYHCNNCHALEHGVSAVIPLLYDESKDEIKRKIRQLNRPAASMPPWCGTDAELDALAEFLTNAAK